MPIAYEGNQPFIFVSYSHRNSRYIHGLIAHLQDTGYRVWFDGGIEAGSEWPEYIASHLERCSCVLTFMSNAFVASDNCKRELHFAQELKKPLLNVYIEDVVLPAGLRMQLGLCQAMYRDNFRTEAEFRDSLSRAKILESCRDKAIETVTMAPVTQADSGGEGVFNWTHDDQSAQDSGSLEEYEKDLEEYNDEIGDLMEDIDDPEFDEDEPEELQAPASKGAKILGWLTILLELSYCMAGPKVLELASASDMSVWMLILTMAIPHVAIAFLNNILLKIMLSYTSTAACDDFALGLSVLCPVTSVVAVFVGIYHMQFELIGLLKFLISLGLNILPAIISIFIYLAIFGRMKQEA